MYLSNKVAKSIRLALVLGAGATAVVGTTTAQEASQDESAEKGERI